MSHTTSLPSLSPREAVTDALYRCVTGIDDNNHELFASGVLQSAESSFAVGDTIIQGWSAVDEYIRKNVLVISTLHTITNIRVNLEDGADTASLTAHAVAYHIRPEDAFKPGPKSFTTAGLYFIDAVKDSSDGLWKIKSWKLKMNWTDGDRDHVFTA